MSESSLVAVVDQAGREHHFDADSWQVTQSGHVDVIKDGKHAEPVATFAPGFLGVYRLAAYVSAPEVHFGAWVQEEVMPSD